MIRLLIENNSSSTSASQCTLNIAGMIIYNYMKGTQVHEKPHENVSINQLTKRETPIITYMSLKLYSSIRSKSLLQRLHQIGICSSYNRVIDLLSGWAENALKVYKAIDQVRPLKLHSGVFTVFTKAVPQMRQQNTFTEAVCVYFSLWYQKTRELVGGQTFIMNLKL